MMTITDTTQTEPGPALPSKAPAKKQKKVEFAALIDQAFPSNQAGKPRTPSEAPRTNELVLTPEQAPGLPAKEPVFLMDTSSQTSATAGQIKKTPETENNEEPSVEQDKNADMVQNPTIGSVEKIAVFEKINDQIPLTLDSKPTTDEINKAIDSKQPNSNSSVTKQNQSLAAPLAEIASDQSTEPKIDASELRPMQSENPAEKADLTKEHVAKKVVEDNSDSKLREVVSPAKDRLQFIAEKNTGTKLIKNQTTITEDSTSEGDVDTVNLQSFTILNDEHSKTKPTSKNQPLFDEKNLYGLSKNDRVSNLDLDTKNLLIIDLEQSSPANPNSNPMSEVTHELNSVGTSLGTQNLSDPKSSPLQTNLPILTPYRYVPLQIGLAVIDGRRSLQLQLSPPDLGKLDISLDISEDSKLVARISADDPNTLAILKSDSPTIRQAIEQSGYTMKPEDLQLSLRQDSNSNQSNHSNQERPQNRHLHSMARQNSLDFAQNFESELPRPKRSLSLLDLSI